MTKASSRFLMMGRPITPEEAAARGCSYTRSVVRFLPLIVFLAGCIGSNYRISGGELDRLAAEPREDRGAALRATQELSFAERSVGDDEEVAMEEVARIVGREIIGGVARATARSRPVRRPRQRRMSVDAPPVGLRATTERGRSFVSDGSSQGQGSLRGGSGGNSGGGGGGGRAGGAAIAIVIVAAYAVGAGILALAASEGARYDGWLQIDGYHRLHLYQNRPGGDRVWIGVPVMDVSPEVAAWADGAILDPSEGRLFQLERSPLNRRGFAISAHGSGSQLYAVTPERVWGGGVRAGIGGFPIHHLGVQVITDIQAATGLLNVRFGGELQGFAPALGRANFGVYFEGGLLRAVRQEEDRELTEMNGYYGGGAIFQVDLTTRLSFDMRGGFYTGAGNVYPTFGAGLSVY
ncbi:MAG: hypothetical protein ACI9KE_003711 [Polyangiales bacterium]|jgi:hypothetical protein